MTLVCEKWTADVTNTLSGKRGEIWCGPYALATVSGMPYQMVYEKGDYVAKCMREERHGRRGRAFTARATGGWYRDELSYTAKTYCDVELGDWKPVEKSKHEPSAAKSITLGRLDFYVPPMRLFIVEISGHYVTVDTRDWTVICNNVQQWTPLKESKFSRCKVKNVCRVPYIHDSLR